ncbi:tetratricopeptide repeat protein [bacterium]|nr:tetratricopeptide repeat protein [candidate division CSSED10-310 bacterium]
MAINKQKILKNAAKYTKKNQYEKAIAEYRKLTQEDFGEPSLANVLGDLLIQSKKINEALAEYEKAGQYYEEKGFLPKALAIYKKILRHDPKLPRIYEKLAQLYSDQGLIQDAITQYEFLAKHHEHEGKTEDALDAYRQIADLDPSNLAIRERLATLYSQQGFPEKACAERVKVGERYIKRGEIDTAIRNFEMGLQEVEGDDAALSGIVSAYLTDKRTDEAIQVLKQLLEKNPRNIGALSTLGRVYMDSGMLDEAVEVFNKVFELDPSQEGVNEILGRIHILRGNYPEAFKRLKDIINVAMEREEYERALGILSQLQELEPANIAIRERKIEIFQKLDRDEDLKTAFRDLAEIYYEKGRLEEAYNIYERLFSMDPHDNPVKQRFNQISIELRGRPIEIGKLVEKPRFETVVEEDVLEEKDLLEMSLDTLNLDDEAASLESLFDTSEIEKISMPVFLDEPERPGEIVPAAVGDDVFSLEGEDEADLSPAEAVEVPAEEQVREFRIKAGVFMKYGLLEKAAERLKTILQIVPEDDESMEKLMEVYERAGEPGKVAEIGTRRVDMALAAGDKKRAGNLLREALKLAPDNELLLERMADLELTGEVEERVPAGDFVPLQDISGPGVSDAEPFAEIPVEEAEVEYPSGGDTAALVEIATEPERVESIQGLEVGSELSSDLAEVVREFREGLVSRHETRDVETHYNLGLAYKEMGLWDEAIEEFKLTLDFPSHMTEGADLLAMCYLEKGEHTKAASVLNKVLKNKDLSTDQKLVLNYDLGVVYKEAGQTSEAKDIFTEIKKTNKNYREVGRLLKELGK